MTAQQFQTRVEAFLEYNAKQRRPVEIAFFGGNFLGQTTDVVQKLLTEAAKFVNQGRADSIRFSTRPDTIDRRRLELISAFPVSTVELGVQSMDNDVLAAARRGHTREDTIEAVQLLKEGAYQIGLQIMVGLPGDDKEKSIETGRQIVNLSPDFVRIYPTVVLEDSPLLRWYRNRTYVPLTLEAAVGQVKDLFLLFRNNGIKIIRMGLQASEDLDNKTSILAGPYHPAFGHMLYSEIFLDRVRMVMESDKIQGEAVDIRVHPKNVSRMRGLNNENIRKLNQLFRLKSVGIIPDSSIAKNKLMINARLIVSFGE